MYAQSHAVHWTQECDQEEGLYCYTRRLTNALLCLTLRNRLIATPISLNKFREFNMKK